MNTGGIITLEEARSEAWHEWKSRVENAPVFDLLSIEAPPKARPYLETRIRETFREAFELGAAFQRRNTVLKLNQLIQ